jgi:preprotein translocase subunit SecY
MIESIRNAFRLPDLRHRILFTLGVLAIYRLAAHVPIPGVNQEALNQLLSSDSATGSILGFMNLLSGGALENFSVMAMGVYPYITASIVIQLLVPLVPALEELSKEGESGRNKLNIYTYWLAIPLAIFQALAQVTLVNNSGVGQVVTFGADAPLQSVAVICSLTAGTMFGLWLGERITEQGIGNGVSIIIFGGIVSSIPQNLAAYLVGGQYLQLLVILAIMLLTVVAIVVIQEGQRRIPVQYGKRVRGMRVYGGQSTHIPLRVNSAGMIPLIFSQSILILPAYLGQVMASAPNAPEFLKQLGRLLESWFAVGSWQFYAADFMLVLIFTFFYTDVVFRQQNLAETLQRQGGFIPGIRPGQRTEDYLNAVMRRITLAGAVFLATVAVIPFLAYLLTRQQASTALLISSAGLLIVVGVVLDTIKQLEAQLLMRHYEGFIK